MLNVVLFEPEIPANTGTIGRSCVLTNSTLHLIGPLGFSLDDKMVRRSGMGYWNDIDLHVYKDYGAFCKTNPEVRPWLCTKKAEKRYSDVSFSFHDWIMFGSESVGIAQDILSCDPSRCIRIPMLEREGISPTTTPGPYADPCDPDAVSLNLSNAANIVIYEALRQLGFPGLI